MGNLYLKITRLYLYSFRSHLRVPYKKQELLTLREHQCSSPILVGFVLLFLLVVVFVFLLCITANIACVSGLSILGCPLRFSLTYLMSYKLTSNAENTRSVQLVVYKIQTNIEPLTGVMPLMK